MIRNTNLIPLAVLISIVGVILVPLSRYGGVYAWPCGRIAVSVCFFYIGCICAGWLKNKLNYKWLVTIGVAAAICFGQKYLFESTPHYPFCQLYPKGLNENRGCFCVLSDRPT